MPVVSAKPTSPGRRFVVKVVSPELHKGGPYEPLVRKKSKTGGRNNLGRITVYMRFRPLVFRLRHLFPPKL